MIANDNLSLKQTPIFLEQSQKDNKSGKNWEFYQLVKEKTAILFKQWV